MHIQIFLCKVLIVLLFLGTSFPARANDLKDAKSPYLLSHKEDAIQWREWSDEVLRQVRETNRPIFLSIGFSSCHWCHVMTRNTFSDERVIAALNNNFVPILVDLEERPDIARHFLDIMGAMVGQSGTPANFILSSNLTPIYAEGYMAPDREYGRPGLVEILQLFHQDWETSATQIETDAAEFYQDHLSLRNEQYSSNEKPIVDPALKASQQWEQAFDDEYGGFGDQPKFPHANVLSFLLHYGVAQENSLLLEKIYTSLDAMAAGGLRDHIGGAFHRYTIDRYWQQPHFEVMLNDNALLARLYTEAWKATGTPERKKTYEIVVKGILDNIISRMTLPDGAFLSSLDAESDDGQGNFYTWTEEDIAPLLSGDDRAGFMDAFVDEKYGLVKGRSVLRIRDGAANFLSSHQKYKRQLEKLKSHRDKRVLPRRDKKILLSWNAMAISAFAVAAQTFDERRYLDVAYRAVETLEKQPRMTHSRLGRQASAGIFLDDYAFLMTAYLDLYETDFQFKWLERAKKTARDMMSLFQPSFGELFQLTSIKSTSEIPVQSPVAEEHTPSGNAVALSGLLRLGLYEPDAEGQKNALTIVDMLRPFLGQSGSQASGILQAMRFLPENAHEIVIVGDAQDPETLAMVKQARQHLLPGTVIALVPESTQDENHSGGPVKPQSSNWLLFSPRPKIDGRVTAYVCRMRLCKLPVNHLLVFDQQLAAIFKN